MATSAGEFVEALQQMPIFGGIRSDIIRVILDSSQLAHLPAGQDFFCEGEPAGPMFVLISGHAVVCKRVQDADCVLRQLDPGDCFGEMALIDLLPRSATVRALEACTALTISPECVSRVYE